LRGKSEEVEPARDRPRPAATFDVIIAGDMTKPGDFGFRVAQEVRHHAASGLRVGLMQVTMPQPDRRIASEVQACVRRGLATIVDPASHPDTGLLILHAPATVSWAERPLAGIRSRAATLVCHDPSDFAVPRLRQKLKGVTELTFAPTSRWLRDAAPDGLPLAADDWEPMLDAGWPPVRARDPKGDRAIGWIVSPGSVAPPQDAAGLHTLDLGTQLGFSIDRVGMFDGLAYFPASSDAVLPDTLIRAALATGVPVALSPWLQPHFGRGPHYCEPHAALDRLTEAKRRPIRRQRQPSPSGSKDGGRQRPVMFVASNGVGIGHLSRLLAIARRLDPSVPLLFATQAQAVAAVERLGYLAQYMPSANYVGGSFEAWDDWFRYELEQLVDAYDPALVVYDGNNPSPGLVRSISSRRDCRLAWVRRGLWGNLTSPHIDNARWFDLIIEPGELGGQPDEGVTARRRDEALQVPPIRLLDDGELLPRSEAAQALGLDPARPAALIQLGAGYNRDVVSLLDHLIDVLKRVPQLQVCIAEWVNGAQPLNYWPEVTYLRGYPLSQYFRAFDFSIAAAGYNTFHEVMTFDLPTIFIPNRHPSMDDQAGRAEHAQALQAAFELDEADLGDLPDLVAIMMDAKARAFLTQNSRKLRQANGAEAAARALTDLLGWVQ